LSGAGGSRSVATLEAAPDWCAPFVSVCAFAGLRLGEAAGLQLADVDFLRRTISVSRQIQGSTKANAEVVPPKHGSERVVYVADELIQVLALHVQTVGVFGDE
jgi:integrase